MTNLAKLTKAQLIAQIEDLRTKYSDLSIGYDQLLHDISMASHQQELDRAADEADAEAAAQSASSKAPSTSRQDRSAQRFETMQKAKALAMSSGRSVKC